jgi:hypothetical protein
MSSRVLLLSAAVLLLAASCGKKSVPQATQPLPKPMPVARIQIAKPLEYTTFNAKTKIQFESGTDKMGSAMSLRMQKGKVIWVSVTPALGIEAVRAKVTPDSIYMVNRIEKTYIAEPIEFLKKKFNVQADFATLQALLAGNQPFDSTVAGKVLPPQDPHYHTRQEKGSLRADNFIDMSNGKLRKVQLEDTVARNSLSVSYSDYAALDNFVFPYASIFLVQQQSTTPPKSAVLTINYNKVTLSEPDLTFPFSVPEGYQRIR